MCFIALHFRDKQLETIKISTYEVSPKNDLGF